MNCRVFFLLLVLLFSVQVNAECKPPIVLDSNTNLPYTGSLEIINNDWGGAVEISTDYINGKKNGEERVYYQSGVLNSLSNYVNGLPEGMIEIFHEDGTLMIRMYFKNGLKEGKAVRYYPNGQLQQVKFFENELEEGESLIWYEDGRLFKETIYENGEIVSQLQYDENGLPIFEHRFIDDLNDESLG